MSTSKKQNSLVKRSALASAVTMALGVSLAPAPSIADIYTFSFTAAGDASKLPQGNGDGSGDALFTMLDPGGTGLQNSSYPYYGDPTWGYGFRTQVSGTISLETADNSGTVTFDPFQFFNGNPTQPATAKSISFEDATSDPGNVGGNPLLLANMLFDWNGNYNIPVSLLWDASGLMSAISGGLNIGDMVTGGSTPASSGINKGKFPVAAAPLATTTFDPTPTGNPNPSGALPISGDDSIGGTPMPSGPFTGFNANFDIFQLQLTGFSDTTPPVITLGGSDPTNLNVGDTYTETATCVDAIDGDITGTNLVIGGGPVNTGSPGTFNLTYDCDDNSTNSAAQQTRTVNVTAAGTPAISLLGNSPETHEAATTYSDAGATCDDGSGGNIPLPTNNPPESFSISSNTVDENLPGSYQVTYSCTNSSGVSAPDAIRSVNVVDTTPPVISLTPTCPITNVADGTDPSPVATATDTVDGAVPVVTTGTVDANPAFGSLLSIDYSLSYSATDSAGNESLSGCVVTQANPLPVGTLLGNATEIVDAGAGFSDPGATCEDFIDGTLPNATPDMVIDSSTPNGTYTITYTCGPNSGGQTGTTTRSVVVGASFSAASDSGSAFSMLDPTGSNVGGADDIFFSWTGALYTDSDTQTVPNMFMGSAQPQPFFGFPWVAHDIRAFGPGSYDIPTSRGNMLRLEVAENQIGAHMLFDWNGNDNIDVVLAWEINSVFAGSPGNNSDDQGSKGQSFGLAVIDSDGDGLVGQPMADGPFAGFNANFNIKMTPQFALPDTSASAAQGGNNPTSIVASTTDLVTVTATVNTNVNDVYSYAGPFVYDWSSSDTTLIGANTNGTNNATFEFNPATLADGAVNAVVKVTDSATGLTATSVVPLSVVTGNLTDPSVQDTDNDGIPDSQDAVDNTATPNVQQAASGNGTSFLVESSAGTLTLGNLATSTGAQTGNYQIGILDTDIPATDDAVDGSCVGGCFNFKVSGLTPGAAVDVVLPLSEAIPSGAGVRKFYNGVWRNFVTTDGNAIMSAAGSLGSCPAPGGAWTDGINPGDFCIKLTIVDGGANDADGVSNGTVVDPSGVSGASTGGVVAPPNVSSASTGGCSIGSTSPENAYRFADWWLIGGLLALLGARSKRRRLKNML